MVGPLLSSWNHAILRGEKVKCFWAQGWEVCDTVDDRNPAFPEGP